MALHTQQASYLCDDDDEDDDNRDELTLCTKKMSV